MRSAIFWDFTQRRMVVSCRRFGTTYRYHLQESSSPRRLLDLRRCNREIVPKRRQETTILCWVKSQKRTDLCYDYLSKAFPDFRRPVHALDALIDNFSESNDSPLQDSEQSSTLNRPYDIFSWKRVLKNVSKQWQIYKNRIVLLKSSYDPGDEKKERRKQWRRKETNNVQKRRNTRSI